MKHTYSRAIPEGYYGDYCEDGIIHTCEHAMMPHLINSDNMYHGWQYYQTTEHMLGVTDLSSNMTSCSCKHYDNPVINCIINWESLKYHQKSTLMASIEINSKTWYACNGDVPNSVPELEELRHMCIISMDDFESWLFKKLYKR